METHALDVVTVLKCLDELERTFLGIGRKWGVKNEEQKRLFEWFNQNRALLEKIKGLKTKASQDWQELNKFLTTDGFDPMFRPFDPTIGIGVASILDKLVKWLEGKALLVEIYGRNGRNYPGFELPPSGVTVYRVHQGLLAELKTKSEDTLWLLLPHEGVEPTGLDMVEMAMEIMDQNLVQERRFAGAHIPKLDFDIKPNINFLLGADTHDEEGKYWYIEQAFQQFKMRMDEEGARVKVATGVVMLKGAALQEPVKLIFDSPFYGWWTQKGLEALPMAVFFSGYDSWKEPAGSLEDL